MKKIYTILFLSLFLGGLNAQTIVWSGLGADNFFSTAANWVGGVVPTTTNNVLFNGTGTKNCDFSLDHSVSSFSIAAGYTGTINCTGFSLDVNGNFSQAAGTFIAPDVDFNILNKAVSSSSIVRRTAGVFNNNSGTMHLYFEDATTINITGFNTATNMLNTLKLHVFLAGTGQRNVNFATTDVNVLNITDSKLFGYQGTLNIKQGLVTDNSGLGIPTSNTANFIFNGTSISISSTSAAGRSVLPNITINANVPVTMSGNISLSGAWTHTISGALAAGTSTVNFYGPSCAINTHTAAPSTATRRAKFHNVRIQTGATCSLGNRSFALLSGAGSSFINNGTFNANTTSILGFSGTGTQNLGGTAAKTTLGSLFSTGTHTVLLGHDVDILDSVKCATQSAKINTNGFNFTLKSTAALKARISQIGGTGAAAIIGNIRVETFAPGGFTGWTNLGASGVNGVTVASWDGQFPMTCSGCIFDETSAGGYFVSMQGYNEPGSGGTEYTELTSSSSIPVGTGVWAYLGDGFTTTSALTWAVSGTASQSTVNVALTRSGGGAQPGYNLVANPYPCPISWSKTRAIGTNATAVQDAIYIFNPDLGVTSAFVGGVTSPAGSGANNIIPMGQGFYVEANSTTSLRFTEASKSNQNTSANPLLRTSDTYSLIVDSLSGDTVVTYEPEVVTPIGTIFRLGITGTSSDYDETVIRLASTASPGFDGDLDAHKIFQTPGYLGYPGPYSKYTSISTKGGTEDYSINSMQAPLSGSLTIPVLAKVMATGPYVISPIEISNLSAFGCVILHDKLLGTYHDLRTGSYNCTINDTTSAPRFELIVCSSSISTSIQNLSAIDNSVIISQDANTAYVKTDFAKSTKAVITAYNLMGQKIIEDVTVEGTSNVTKLNFNNIHSQIVIIKVATDKTQTTKKVFID